MKKFCLPPQYTKDIAEKNEEIYLPGNSTPIVLPRRSDALRLLQRVRDETHRFATSKNQQLRTKENVSSPFLLLPGVGQKRAHALQLAFGSLEGLVGEETAVGIGDGRNNGSGTCIGGDAGAENSSHAQVSRIMECIKVSRAEAQEIISVAKDLLDAQKEKQSMQKLSLGISGTTKEKAAKANYLNNLAAQALALQGHKEVAEKEADYGGRKGE